MLALCALALLASTALCAPAEMVMGNPQQQQQQVRPRCAMPRWRRVTLRARAFA
jgi:hypothetical protein